MAQPGNFTPLLLYASSTATNVPLAANLTNSATGSELAINIADKNLFFKDSGGAVNIVPIRQSSASSNGWLSSTDWNTFNSKAPATSGTSILYGNGSGGFSNVTIGTGITFAGGTLSATGSGGTVTSVTGTSPVVSSGGTTPAISLATAYGDTLNPYASKTANYILAAPNGSAGVPTFRALVAADLPSLSGTYIPYTGASSAIDLNAQTVTNIAHLGINTTSVPTILLRAIGDNNSGSRIAMRGYSSNASSSSIRVTKFRGTFAAPQAPQSGDSLGKFELAGYGTTSSDGYPQASYEGVATETWGATARGTKTLFYTTPNTTTTQTLALTLNQDQTATFASTVTATSFSGSGSSLTGVVTSITGTSPVVSSGGTTPAISMPAATTSVSGYLTSTDWNTFNNKGSGTVTSVTGTAPVVSSGGAAPAISMAAATSSVNGYLTSTDWTTFNSKQPAGSYLTAVSVVSTNGFAGTSSGGTTPALTLSTSITGILKGNGTAISAATSGTDYAPATSGSSILYGNGAGGFSNVTVGTGLTFVSGTLASTAGTGTVTSVAATVPAFLSISGSPITTSGTLAITLSGIALPVANGGTGLTTLTAGYIPYGNGTSAFSSSSSLYFDGTNLGVGTSSPTTLLAVNKNQNSATTIGLTNTNAGSVGNARILIVADSGNIQIKAMSSTNTTYGAGNVGVINCDTMSGGLRFAHNDVVGMTLDSSNNLLVGTTSTFNSAKFSISYAGATVNGSAIYSNITGASSAILFQNPNGTVGQIYTSGSLTVYLTSSDYRLKTVIGSVSDSGQRIDALEPIEYDWNTGGRTRGFLAHKFAEVYPNSVSGKKDEIDKDGKPVYQGIQAATSEVMADLIAEIQSLRKRIATLETK